MNSHKLILKDPKIKNYLCRVKRINPHNNNKNNHKVVIKLTPFLKWMFYKPNRFPRAKNRYNITPNHQLINCKLNRMKIMNKSLHNFFRLIKKMFNIWRAVILGMSLVKVWLSCIKLTMLETVVIINRITKLIVGFGTNSSSIRSVDLRNCIGFMVRIYKWVGLTERMKLKEITISIT